MPVEFEGQLPETPYIFRIRLTCDHCRERLEVELPVDYPEAEDAHSRLMNEALRYVGRHGWQWDSPGEGAYQVVTCHQCRGRQRQLQRALADLPGSTLTSQQLINLSQTMAMGTVTNMESPDFINRGALPSDIVTPMSVLSTPPRIVTDSGVPEGTLRLVADQNTLLAHPNDEERYREEVAAMIAQSEGDPDFHVFARADVELARVGNVAIPWDGSRPPDPFRSEVMGVFPDPPDERVDRVAISGGTFVDREGRTWETGRFEVEIPHSAGRREIGIDPGLGDDTAMAQVLIDGVPTGDPIPLRRDHTRIEPLRKSKWERLMEDDGETCP